MSRKQLTTVIYLHKDLHATSQAKNQVKCGLLLDVVVGKSTAIFKLLSSKDETLLIRGNAFLVLDLRLDVVDRIARFNFQRYGFTGECLNRVN